LTDGPIFHSTKGALITVTDGDVVPALELGIRFMQVGETALIWSHFKYGPYARTYDNYDLPPNTNVLYKVTVRSILDENEPDFGLRVSIGKKELANDLYAHEWPGAKQRMLQLYRRAATNLQTILQTDSDNDDTTNEDALAYKQQALDVTLDCLNNIAAVYIRAKDYHKAKQAAVALLELDANNVKGLLRAAKAAMMDSASSYEEVEAAIVAVEDIGTDVDEVKALRQQLKRRKQEYSKKSKELMANMSQGTIAKRASDLTKSNSNNMSNESVQKVTIQNDEDSVAADLEKLDKIKAQLAHDYGFQAPSLKTYSRRALAQILVPLAVWFLIRYFQLGFSGNNVERGLANVGGDDL
jgi:hypothetical protein